MNPAVRDYIQSKVKIWANKVDEVGRRNILKNLTETSDPWASIVQIKEDSALNCKEAFPAITFLNKLGSPTYSIHQSIFDNMENALIKEIQRFDQAKMLMMLPLTIHFLAISGLKDIPIFLIKNLSKVPEKYIHHLAKNCDLQEFPMSVRRQVWEMHEDLFVVYIEPLIEPCFQYYNQISERRQLDSELNKLCEAIGGSEKLFSFVTNYCMRTKDKDKTKDWSRLLRDLILTVHSSEKKLSAFGKLNDLAWTIDSSLRQNQIDINSLRNIVSILESLIITQSIAIDDIIVPTKPAVKDTKTKMMAPIEKKQESSQPQSSVAPKILELRDILMQMWRFVTHIDKRKVFANKVTDIIAPGYSSIIHYPMDLKTMRKKISNGTYDSFNSCLEDFQLIFQNCRDYNGKSWIGKYGDQLEEKLNSKLPEFRSLLKNIGKPNNCKMDSMSHNEISDSNRTKESSTTMIEDIMSKSNKSKVQEDPSKSMDEEVFVIAPKEIPKIKKRISHYTEANMRDYLKSCDTDYHREIFNFALAMLRNSDRQYQLFYEKVDGAFFRDYYDIVKYPMYFKKMEEKIKKGKYQNLQDVSKDVKLIIDNCFLYNGPGEISEVAQKVWKEWSDVTLVILEKLWNEKPAISPAKPNDHAVNKSEGSNKLDEGLILKVKIPHAEASNVPNPIVPPDDSAIDIFIHIDLDNIIQHLSEVTFLSIEELCDYVWNMLVDIDSGNIFAPKASGAIDLGIIRVKIDCSLYRTVAQFTDDISKMITTKYSKSNHDIAKAIQQLKDTWPKLSDYMKMNFSHLEDNSEIEMIESPPHTIESTAPPMIPSEKVDDSIETRKKRPRSDDTSTTVEKQKHARLSENIDSNHATTTHSNTIIVPAPIVSAPIVSLSNGSQITQRQLQLMRQAAQTVRQKGSHLADLPKVFMDSKLALAIFLLNDFQLQNLLLSFLSKKLIDNMHLIGGFRGNMKMDDMEHLTLPSNDPVIRLLCQLTQLPYIKVEDPNVLPSVNENVVHHFLPYIALEATFSRKMSEIDVISLKVKEIIEQFVADESSGLMQYLGIVTDSVLSYTTGLYSKK